MDNFNKQYVDENSINSFSNKNQIANEGNELDSLNNNDMNGYYNNNEFEEILYKDECIVVYNKKIKIFKYYYPLTKEKIIYFDKIKSIKIIELSRSTGKYKFFGLNWDLSWYHFDRKRPLKEKLIQINDGSKIKISITPNEPDKVYKILNEKINKSK
jgi:hypothetical protein